MTSNTDTNNNYYYLAYSFIIAMIQSRLRVVDHVDVELILIMKFWATAKVANGALHTNSAT
jgi:Na+/H+-dicarboxylate symporter